MNDSAFIHAEEVSKYYKDGKVVALDKITMDVKKGEFFVVRGASGSGKSTLLHLLGGLDKPSSGEIYFKGRPLTQLFKKSGFRINTIGFVFQAFYLWPTLNVLENVLLPLMEVSLSSREKVKWADSFINVVGLEHKRKSSVRNLSIGERQRVAIARALVTNPQIVLADEPTGSLDSKNAENILRLFKQVNKDRGVTIIMATHQKIMDDLCDRTIELRDGRMI